jgi:hypothetical protein
MNEPADQRLGAEDLRERALLLSDGAELAWAEAIRGHLLAPPDAGFPRRLRALAAAARRRAEAARVGADAGLRWVPTPDAVRSQPPPELRPDSGRTGATGLWEEFDAAVTAVNRADAGTSLTLVADAADALADAAEAIAADVECGQAADVDRAAGLG